MNKRNYRKGIQVLSTIILLLLFFSIAIMPSFAAANNKKIFTSRDISSILEGFETVQDYVDALKPSSYSWFYMGEATGETIVTMNFSGGAVGVCIEAPDGKINGKEESKASKTALPQSIRDLEVYSVSSISWVSSKFTAISPPRGIKIGASKSSLINAYKNTGKSSKTFYTYKDINSKAKSNWCDYLMGGSFIKKGTVLEDEKYKYDTIAYGWCTPYKQQYEWREYYQMRYELTDAGKVRAIHFLYFTDAE